VEEFEMLSNPRNCEIIVLEKTSEGKFKLKVELAIHDTTFHSFQRPIKI